MQPRRQPQRCSPWQPDTTINPKGVEDEEADIKDDHLEEAARPDTTINPEGEWLTWEQPQGVLSQGGQGRPQGGQSDNTAINPKGAR